MTFVFRVQTLFVHSQKCKLTVKALLLNPYQICMSQQNTTAENSLFSFILPGITTSTYEVICMCWSFVGFFFSILHQIDAIHCKTAILYLEKSLLGRSFFFFAFTTIYQINFSLGKKTKRKTIYVTLNAFSYISA